MGLVDLNRAGIAAEPALHFGGVPISLTVLNDVSAAEAAWRRLERGGALMSPYQRFDLLAAWQSHVGAPTGVKPVIVIGEDPAGEPLFLWPLGISLQWPVRVLHFLGGKHVSFNLGLWRRDLAAKGTGAETGAVVRELAHHTDADLMALLRQPTRWQGIDNPFAALPHQACADQCARLDIDRPGQELIKEVVGSTMRGRLRTKERRLRKLPGYRATMATSEAEVDRLLGEFFVMKSAHMAAQGIPNVFAEPGVKDFIRNACRSGLAEGHPAVELHSLECDGEVLALFGASCDHERFSLMFNTYTLGDHGRQSPGLVLLLHLMQLCADRGLKTFDLGVGQAYYKSFFCKEPEPLFDSFIPLTSLGRIAAHGLGAAHGAKRRMKESPALRDTLQFVRRLRARTMPQEG